MWSKSFWVQTAERAVKTFAQTVAALLAVDGLGLLSVDWTQVGQVAGLAAVVSVLTSIGSAPAGQPNTPSLVPVAPEPPSSEAVRILSRPGNLDPKLAATAREAARKAGPGAWQ